MAVFLTLHKLQSPSHAQQQITDDEFNYRMLQNTFDVKEWVSAVGQFEDSVKYFVIHQVRFSSGITPNISEMFAK